MIAPDRSVLVPIAVFLYIFYYKIIFYVFTFQAPYVQQSEKKKYHDFLERQIEERNAMTRIGQFEEKRQAKEVYTIWNII